MKNLYLYKLGLGIIVGLFLTSCSSSYSRYWHEEEDDVYFTSRTKEEVEAYETFHDDSNESEKSWEYRDSYPQNNRVYQRSRRRSVYSTTPSIPRSYPKSNGGIKAPTPTRKTTPTTPTKKDNSIKN